MKPRIILEKRAGRGNRGDVLEAVYAVLRECGPLTASELSLELRRQYNIDVTRTQLASRLKRKNDTLSYRWITRKFQPNGTRTLREYFLTEEE